MTPTSTRDPVDGVTVVTTDDGFSVSVGGPPVAFEGTTHIVIGTDTDETDLDLTDDEAAALRVALNAHEGKRYRAGARVEHGPLRTIEFRDSPDGGGGLAGTIMVVQGPVLFNGAVAAVRIRRDLPLRVVTNGGLGRSEVLVSFVVHRDDVTWPLDDGVFDKSAPYAIGGYEVSIPPLTDEHTWHYEESTGAAPDLPFPVTDSWVRVWIQTTPVFNRDADQPTPEDHP